MSENKAYKCLIIDDEPIARQLIKTHIANIPELIIIKEFSLAVDAITFLQTNKIDIIFLDIQMPKLTGIDFIKALKNSPKIIFTTAFSEFAIDAFELNVIDYLLKPIVFERFKKAVDKTIEILQIEDNNLYTSKYADNSIVIKSKHKLIRVLVSDILYIESMHKYIRIFTAENRYTTLFSLNAIEQELPSNIFYRCHRSFIINLNKVKLIDGNHVILDNYNVPISKTNKSDLIKKIGRKI